MKKKNLSILLLSLFLLVSSGCSGGSSEHYNSNFTLNKGTTNTIQTSQTTMDAENSEEITQAVPSENIDISNQKKIKSGNISLETNDYDKMSKNVNQILKKYNGYIYQSNEYKYEKNMNINLVLKVNSNSFDKIFEEIKQLGIVRENSIQTEDVSMEYIDTESRIKTLKVQENTLLKIMSETKTVDEMLRVQNELQRIRGDIEANQGRINFLDNSINYSTINLSINVSSLKTKDDSFSSKLIFNIQSSFSFWINILKEIIFKITWFLPVIIVVLPMLGIINFIGNKRKIKDKDKDKR